MKTIQARLIPVMTVLLLSAACALSPQQVQVRPELSLPQGLPAGQPGRTVALQVSDARGTNVVGKRGGVYETATITTDPAMTITVRDELGRILTARGYQVVDTGQEADIRLIVEIASLDYGVTQQKVTKLIETTATVRAVSRSGDSQRTGEYSDRRTKEVVKAPSAADNEELVNAVLSAALQRVVADADLLRY